MKRFVLAIALTFALSASALAGDIPMDSHAPSPGDIPMTGYQPGEIPIGGSAGEMPICGLLLMILDLGF
jgi:hypothetical protein